MGVGTGIGAGIKGYYGAKNARNESEATDAKMRIQELEDQLRELEQANEVAKVPEQAARDRHTAAQESARRKGEMYEAEGEMGRATRKRAGEQRTEGIAVKEQPGKEYEAEGELGRATRKRAGEQRTERVAVKEQPSKEAIADDSLNKANRGIKREEQVAGQENAQVDAQQIVQAVPGVVAATRASGSPAPIDDFYAENLPNGHTVTTTEDPDVPGGYILTDNMGNEKKAANLEEIIAGFEKSFTSQEMIDKMLGRGNLGREPGQYRPDVGGIRSRYGRGGTGRGGTQLERMYPQVVEDLAQRYPEMEEWELRLTAIKFLKERGGEPSDVFRRKWTADMMEAIMGMSDIGDKKKKAMEQFWEMSELLFGAEGSKPGADDGELTDDEQADAIFDGS